MTPSGGSNSERDQLDEFLDGWALWQEHQPQTSEDWIAVAERFNEADGDRSKSSVMFRALSIAVEERDAARGIRRGLGGQG